MGLMDKSEKLADTMGRYKRDESGKIDVESLTKDQMFEDLRLIADITLILLDTLDKVDDEISSWELASSMLDGIEDPYLKGFLASLDISISSLSEVLESDI